MPGTLDNNHTMVSALYQFIKPKADHLLLTDTIVGGNLQVKGSLNAPSFKTTTHAMRGQMLLPSRRRSRISTKLRHFIVTSLNRSEMA